MSDTIEVTAAFPVERWRVPDTVLITADDVLADEGAEGAFSIPMEQAPADVIDALAEAWLGSLYARRNERNPFRRETSLPDKGE